MRPFSIRRCFARPRLIGVALAVVASAAVAHVQVAPTPVAVLPTDRAVACVVGVPVHIGGHFTASQTLSQRLLLVDRHPVAAQEAEPTEDDYAFDWTPRSAGDYTLQVQYLLGNGEKVYVQRIVVEALDKAPLALDPFPHTGVADADVAARPTPGSAFVPARVDFAFDGKPLTASTASPFTTRLPIEATPSGSHPLTFQAFDAQGARYAGGAEAVQIPERVELHLPGQFDAAGGGKLALAPAVYPGLKLSQVSFSLVRVLPVTLVSFAKGRVDGSIRSEAVPLGVGDGPTFGAAADLSGYAPGSYEVRAHAVADDGAEYDSPSYPLTVSNPRNVGAQPAALAALQSTADGLTALNAQIEAYHALVRAAREDMDAMEAAVQKADGFQILALQYQELRDSRDAQTEREASKEAFAAAQTEQGLLSADQSAALTAFNGLKADPLFAQFYREGERAVPVGQSGGQNGGSLSERFLLRLRPVGTAADGLHVVEPR